MKLEAGKFLNNRIKAKGSVVVLLAIISILGFLFNILEIMFLWTFLPAYSGVIAQFLLGLALFLETKPKKRYYHTTIGEDWLKSVLWALSLLVMATALIRLPFLSFLGLADLEWVKTLTVMTYLFGVLAIVIEVFLKD